MKRLTALVAAASAAAALGSASSTAGASPVPLYGPRYCLSFTPTVACGPARGFTNPMSAAMSPDGRSIYLPSGNEPMVGMIHRKADGTLRQPRGSRGCVASGAARRSRDARARTCALAQGFGAAALDAAVSPDGRHVYVATGSDEPLPGDRFTVVGFARGATGRLTPLRAGRACIANKTTAGCAVRAGLWATSVSVSPDGVNVYVGGRTLSVFRRDPATGALTFEQCLSDRGLAGCEPSPDAMELTAPAWSADGRFGYARGGTFRPSHGVGTNDVLVTLARAPDSGRVVAVAGGCIARARPACARDSRLATGADWITPPAIAPGGRHVYVGTEPSGYDLPSPPGTPFGVLGFTPGSDGGALVPATDACLHVKPLSGCVRDTGLRYTGEPLLSPDGRRLYMAGDDRLTVLARDPESGRLSRVRGVMACFAPGPCRVGRAPFGGVNSLLVAPDGRFLYAIGHDFYGTGTITTLAL